MHREPRPDGTRRGSPSSAPTGLRVAQPGRVRVPPPSPGMPAAEAHREYFPHVGLQLPAGVRLCDVDCIHGPLIVHHLWDDFRPAHRLGGQRVRRGIPDFGEATPTKRHYDLLFSQWAPRGMQDRLWSSRVSRSIAAAVALVLVSGMTRLSLAQASERWHLLVRPVAG